MSGTKHDQDKPRMELLPMAALREVSKVLTFGSTKYEGIDTERVEECLQKLNVSIMIEKNKPSGYVGLVMKNTSKLLIQNTEKELQPINENIDGEIKNDCQNMQKNIACESQRQQSKKEIKDVQSFKESMGLLWKKENPYYKNKVENVLFAEGRKIDTTLTTVIPLEKCEESFVLGATTASGFLMTLKKVLSEHLNILEVPGIETGVITGDNNWRGGLEYSRLYGAMLRHLTSFVEGEDIDPESQLSHIAHMVCGGLFLLTFILEERNELDDRPKEDTK